MGERLLCKQEVIGSIPFTSTISRRLMVCLGSRDSDIPWDVTTASGPGTDPPPRWPLKTIAEASVCLQCACIAGVFFDR